MLEQLKKKSAGERMTTLIVVAIIAVLVVVFTKFVAFRTLTSTKLTGASDFAALEGKYVSFNMQIPIEIYETMGTHNYDTNRDTVKQNVYLVWDEDNDVYFGIARPVKKESEMEDMLDQAWDYLVDEGDAPKPEKITGQLVKMDATDKKYCNELVEEFEALFGDDYKIDVEYYYINEGKIGDSDVSTARILTILAVIAIGIAGIWFVLSKNSWDKSIKKFVSKNGMVTYDQMLAEIERGKMMNGGATVITDKYLFNAESSIKVCDLKTVCWGYYFRRTGRNSVSQMRLYYAEGGMFAVNASQPNTVEMLEYLDNTIPYILVGYDKDMDKMYNKSRDEFLNIKYNQGKREQQEAMWQGADQSSDPYQNM